MATAGGVPPTVIALEVTGLTPMLAPVALSVAEIDAEKARVPAPLTPPHCSVKVWLPPEARSAEEGLGAPQLAEAVPVDTTPITGETPVAALPELAMVTLTEMLSPGFALEPPGAEALTDVTASITDVTLMLSDSVTLPEGCELSVTCTVKP